MDLEIFFVTNRDILSADGAPWFGARFNPDGPSCLRFGRATGEKKGDEYAVTGVTIAPEQLGSSDSGGRVVGSKAVMDALKARMTGKGARDTLVLIHGYASTFETALQRGLQLAAEYRPHNKPLNIVVFSWPSNGTMTPFIDYHSDRDDARDSGEAMARAVLILRQFVDQLPEEERCDRHIHLVAHSMGNYALRAGVQHLRRLLGDELPRLFAEIVLVAADEDDDSFEHDHKLRLLPRLGRRVSVYFAPQDRALIISDTTKGNPDRLGSDGPKQVSGLPTKIVLLDCREVALVDDKWTAHQYYRSNARTRQDIVHTLEGLPADRIRGRTHIPELRAWRLSRTLPRQR